MYKILLCEKNRYESSRISKIIYESTLDYDIIKAFFTPTDIISQISEENISILLCNVNIGNNFGGFNFFESVMKMKPTLRIIFYGELTGMGDSHAYKRMATAVHNGEVIYLPMNFKRHELMTKLRDATDIINQINTAESKNEEIEELYLSNKNSFRERLLLRLIKDEHDNEDELIEAMQYFNINLKAGYTTLIIKIDNYNTISKLSEYKKSILTMKLHKMVEDDLTNQVNSCVFVKSYDEIVTIIGDSIPKLQLIQLGMNIKYSILDSLKIKVSIGISHTKDTVSNIWISYREASSAVSHGKLFGNNSVVHIDYIDNENEITYIYPRKKELKLIEETMNGNHEIALELLNDIFASLKECTNLPENMMNKIVLNILFELDRRSSERNAEMEGIMLKVKQIAKSALDIKTLDAAYRQLGEIISIIAKEVQQLYKQHKLMLFIKLTKYISENVGYVHSVESLAQEFNTTPKAIKHAIKENTNNITVLEYILQLKIKASKMLLLNSGLDIFTVSDMLGFDSLNSFKANFEKIEGISVAKYTQTMNHFN